MTDVLEVVPAGPLEGAVAAPASKSVTNRLLVIAALAGGRSRLGAPLESDDSAAMRDVVTGLGADVRDEGRSWAVQGTGGQLAVPDGPLDCRLSGTTIRFGTAVAALAAGPVSLTGREPLRRRPIGPLTGALRALGARADDTDGFPPVTVGGGLPGGEVTVDVGRSSQFASALLLAAPYADRDVAIRVAGVHARAYVDLTVAAMVEWGAQVHDAPWGWTVAAGRGYTGRDVLVEYDASAAAHLFALAVASGGVVTVTNAVPGAAQPDTAITHVLDAMGGTIDQAGTALTVRGPDRVARAVRVDLTGMPDQVTTVAALAALAEGPTTITGAEVARGHETDRLAALATELRKLGTQVEERPDGLVIDGSRTRGGPAVLETYDDHRLAMAFAALGTRLPGIRIADPGCVAKTYPRFWDDLAALGGTVRRP